MALFQAGFWKDYVAALVVTIVVGAFLAAGVAGGLDAAFGQVLGEVFGAPDEYGLIVHVRAESTQAAGTQISELLSNYDADIVVRRGVTVAGNANFLIALPDHLLQTEWLEQLPVALQQLSGFNGYTWLLEPSVTVTGMRPAVRDIVAARAASLPGVRAVVRQGTGITVILDDEAERQVVTDELEQWLTARQVAEIHLPDDASALLTQRVLTSLDEALQSHSWRVLTSMEGTGDARLDKLVAGLEQLPRAWQQVSAAGAATADTLAQLGELIDGLQPALALVEQPEEQAERIARALREGDSATVVKDVLLNVATTMLLQSLTGGVAKAAPGDEPAAPAEHSGPDSVSAKPSDGAQDGARSPLDQLRQLRVALDTLATNVHTLAALSEPDLNAAMEALEQLVPSAESGPGRLELLVDEAVPPDVMERAVHEALQVGGAPDGDVPRVFVAAPGVVNPNPRAMVANLLVDVRRTIAGLLAFLIAAFALVFDHAGVFAALKQFDVPRAKARTLAAAVGALLFGTTYALAGAGMPTLGAGSVADIGVMTGVGALIGLLTLRLSPRLSPVDGAEILAGRSLGLNEGQVMREIVIPAGRPGVLTFINRHRRRFV